MDSVIVLSYDCLPTTETSNFGLSQSVSHCVFVLVGDRDVYLGYLEFLDQSLVIFALEYKEWLA